MRNTNSEEPIRIYFASESLTDPAASSWLSFIDRDGVPVSAQSLILIPPGGTQTVTLRVSVPGSAATDHYTMEVWLSNDQHARISEKRAFSVEAVTPTEATSSSLMLYGVAAVLFAGIAGGGYWYVSRDDEDYDDEEGDSDEPSAVAPMEGLPVASVEAVPVAAVEAAPPVATTTPVADVTPVVPQPAPVVVAQPAAVEAVAVQPVVAAPVAAQPVVAQPVEATPVEAVAVQPVEATPVEAVAVEAVAVQPVEAGAVEATPVVVKAQVVEDEDEMEFS